MQGMLRARPNQSGPGSSVSAGLSIRRAPSATLTTLILEETDKAMAWLERTVETGFACPSSSSILHLESLREEPEFKRLVSDLEQEYASLKIQRL
jgi:hypothetical protein